MKEAFEKIKERLKKEKIGWLDFITTDKRYVDAKIGAYDKAIEIVNQLAEEYKDSEMLNLAQMNADFQNAKLEELKKLSEKLTSLDVPDINVGENEDFCEWIRDNDEFDVYDTKCRNRHVFFEGNPEDNEYVYCPYCGKEIKVVE